jgi:catechol 2,3-dioxygenase-like lactoylglutathione lyase family enzyme
MAPDLKHCIAHVALVVRDYDEAINFYVNKLQFELVGRLPSDLAFC